ncbi:MAG TPA: ketopantoate reductase C-terminal domain-containing protein [Paraburkholderia sp.]
MSSPASDFKTLQWRKLLLNAVANPITALTRQRLVVFRRDDMRELCLALLDEAVKVARADGAHFADDEAATIFATLMSYPTDVSTSMYFDNLEGRPLEVGVLSGAIVEAGERYSIPTPINRTLATLLQSISDAARDQPIEPRK